MKQNIGGSPLLSSNNAIRGLMLLQLGSAMQEYGVARQYAYNLESIR